MQGSTLGDTLMTENDLLDRLASHETVGAPRQELEWLAAHGTVRRLQGGDTLDTRTARVI
jgi:hypothetical protein